MDLGAALGPVLVRVPPAMRLALRIYARTRGCSVDFERTIDVSRDERTIRISRNREPYVRDIVDNFDHYFEAVVHDANSSSVCDYASVREQRLRGWNGPPVLVPGLPEPMETAAQYVALTRPMPGQTVLDLGAYAGLTAMVFCDAVGPEGRVIAVEADPTTAECARANFARFYASRGFGPELVKAAVWSSSGYVDFAAEAALGSAVAEVLPRAAGSTVRVPTTTLSGLAGQFGLSSVDVIKADIEGAEYRAFSDRRFFERFQPKIVFEPAQTRRRETRLGVIADLLASYGYELQVVTQDGSRLPLVVCTFRPAP